MSFLLFFALFAIFSFVFHFVWEKLHIGLYRGYEKLGTGMPLTLMATEGDCMYALLAVLFVSLVKQQLQWLLDPTLADYGALAVLGFAVALFVEYKAFALKRWAYTKSMPTLLGVGVSPLLQMTLLLPFAVFSTAITFGALHIVPLGV